MIKAEEGQNFDNFTDEIEGALRTERKIKPGEKKDFAINKLSTAMDAVNAIFKTINMIGLMIAGFSLLVGGFGIANIMFVTVKERTKIIGLKKAIGAKPRSILIEFLIEAITLCLAGGLIGIIAVLILSLVITHTMDFPITLSLENFLTGVGISATVGILAGFIPARTASKLNPVVAIRSN
jgi:putative ABC transport system permease protein